MNTKSGLKAILVSLYSKGGASDCCNFQTKIASSFGLGFFFLSKQVAPKTSVSMLAHIWVLSCKYFLVAILVQGRVFWLKKKSLHKKKALSHKCACESSLLDSTRMFHDGDMWSPWIKRLEWGQWGQ